MCYTCFGNGYGYMGPSPAYMQTMYNAQIAGESAAYAGYAFGRLGACIATKGKSEQGLPMPIQLMMDPMGLPMGTIGTMNMCNIGYCGSGESIESIFEKTKPSDAQLKNNAAISALTKPTSTESAATALTDTQVKTKLDALANMDSTASNISSQLSGLTKDNLVKQLDKEYYKDDSGNPIKYYKKDASGKKTDDLVATITKDASGNIETIGITGKDNQAIELKVDSNGNIVQKSAATTTALTDTQVKTKVEDLTGMKKTDSKYADTIKGLTTTNVMTYLNDTTKFTSETVNGKKVYYRKNANGTKGDKVATVTMNASNKVTQIDISIDNGGGTCTIQD